MKHYQLCYNMYIQIYAGLVHESIPLTNFKSPILDNEVVLSNSQFITNIMHALNVIRPFFLTIKVKRGRNETAQIMNIYKETVEILYRFLCSSYAGTGINRPPQRCE